MPFLFHTGRGGNFVLPLVCVLGLAFGTLITGMVAAREGSPARIRIFWSTMALFLAATTLLIGALSHWGFTLVLVIPATLLFFLFRTGRKRR